MTETAPGGESGLVELGRVARAHGVHGALIITPFTATPQTILEAGELELRAPDGGGRRRAEGFKGKLAAQGIIAKIKNVTTREAAEALKGWLLVAPRASLPPPPDDEVYRADLLNLAVFTPQGRALGRVRHLVEAGGNLLLAVEDPAEDGRERLLPFHENFLAELDIPGGRLIFDPPPGLLDI